MELDDLKSQLINKLASDHSGRSDADIAILLTKRTESVTGKLKKSLWIEVISCIVITIAFGYISLASSLNSFRIYFSVFTVVAIVFLCILIYLLRRTMQLSSSTLPVKSNLQAIVKLIEEFMRRYFQFTMALIPVCFVFAFILGYNEKQGNAQLDHLAKGLFSSAWQVVLFLIVYLAGLAAGIYYFTRWYLKKMFGKYVLQLKACIADLGSNY